MEKDKKLQREKVGKPGYINENCWLAKTLNYAPYKRCQHCELKFHNCLFLHYQIISLALIIFFVALSFLVKEITPELVIISVFSLVIIYGYSFAKSTDKIIEANFAQREAKEALEELNKGLEKRVNEQTEKIEQAYKKIEKAYEVEKKTHEELKKLDEAKSEFISIASHQLRTPLSAIKGYISLLLEGTYGQLQEKAKPTIEKIYQANERLIKLTSDLLTISRIEAEKMQAEKEMVSLEEIINGALDILKIRAQEKGLYLKLEKPEKALPKISLDKDKINQVILNLIDNAIRYTEKGGIKIKVKNVGQLASFGNKAKNNEKTVLIEVKDTGIGMTQEEIKEIFTSFSRGIAGSKHWTEGTGLGLYVAKKFVEMHQGRIWAESEGEGKGSTFNIELPIL